MGIIGFSKMIIYKVTNKINGMIYIGQTVKSLNRRKAEHFYNSRKGATYFNRALNKYGEKTFTWIVLGEYSNITELNKWEKYFIKQHRTKIPNGYNLTDGGEGIQGLERTEDHNKKISESRLGKKHWMYGKHLSDEHKQKVSRALIGHPVSNETRKKIGKGNSIALKGKKLSKERREKFIDAGKKDYIVSNFKTNKKLIIRGLSQFCRDHNLSQSGMRRVLNGIQKQGHHQGWVVKHMEV